MAGGRGRRETEKTGAKAAPSNLTSPARPIFSVAGHEQAISGLSCFNVVGISMLPTVQEGDVILCEPVAAWLPPQSPAVGAAGRWLEADKFRKLNGQMVAAVVNGERCLKRLECQSRTRGRIFITLRSDNPDVPARVVDDNDDVMVIGRVVAIQREVQ